MEKWKHWLLPADEDMDAEITANLVGELALLSGFMGISICNAIRGKDNRPLLIVILGFLAGKWVGRFLETHEKKSLLFAVLNLLSGVLYTISYLLESRENEGEQ